jgi:hypothetical protein
MGVTTMGVPVALLTAVAAAELAKAAAEVAEKLNTARTCVLEFKNHTNHPLRLVGQSHDHGGFKVPPNDELPPHTADVFGAQSDSFSVATGVEGSVTYQIGTADATVTLRWNNPFIGENDSSAGTGGNRAAAFTATSLTGNGNDAHMKYFLREESSSPWSQPFQFGQQIGKVEGLTMIQSNYGSPGNLEMIARAGDALHFFFRDAQWHGPFGLAGGAGGNPVLIQSRFGSKGNFELVYPDAQAGIRFMWRNNDAAGAPWSQPFHFAQQIGKVDGLTMIQSNYGSPGNLEMIARTGETLHFFWRDSGPTFTWNGPFPIASGASGNPVLIQSRFGNRGNFELVYPDAQAGIRFMWRNNG